MEEGHEFSVTFTGVGALFETKFTSQKRGVNSTAQEIIRLRHIKKKCRKSTKLKGNSKD
jgi:phage terminase small subunit